MLFVLTHECELDRIVLKENRTIGDVPCVATRIRLSLPLTDEEVEALPVVGPAAKELLDASRGLVGKEGKNSHHLDTKFEFETLNLSFSEPAKPELALCAFDAEAANKPRIWAVEGEARMVVQFDAWPSIDDVAILAGFVGREESLLVTSTRAGAQPELPFVSGDKKVKTGGNGQLSPEVLEELEAMGVMALRKKAAEIGIKGMTGKPKELVLSRIIEHLS